MKRSVRLQLLQDEMKRRAIPVNEPPVEPSKPKCTATGCTRFARKNSILCSRCTIKSVEANLRDTLPGLEMESGLKVEFSPAGNLPLEDFKLDYNKRVDTAIVTSTLSKEQALDLLTIKNQVHSESKGYYTRKQVAQLLGVSPTSICRWEIKGKTPPPKRQVYNNQLVYTEAHVQLLKEFMTQQVTIDLVPAPERQRAQAAKGVAKKTFKLSKGLERTVASRLGRMSLVSGKLM